MGSYPKQSSNPSIFETWNTINQLSFCQFLKCQAPPRRNAKPPIENFLATFLVWISCKGTFRARHGRIKCDCPVRITLAQNKRQALAIKILNHVSKTCTCDIWSKYFHSCIWKPNIVLFRLSSSALMLVWPNVLWSQKSVNIIESCITGIISTWNANFTNWSYSAV